MVMYAGTYVCVRYVSIEAHIYIKVCMYYIIAHACMQAYECICFENKEYRSVERIQNQSETLKALSERSY